MREVRVRRKTAEDDIAALNRQIAKMRAMFEGCLVIMEDGGPKKGDGISVATDKAINGAVQLATERGLIEAGKTEHQNLPLVLGNTEDCKALFGLVISTISTRSAADEINVVFGARAEKEAVVFTVRQVGELDNEAETLPAEPEADAGILIAALQKAARVQGGALLGTGGEEDGNQIVFSLPADTRPVQSLEMGDSSSAA